MKAVSTLLVPLAALAALLSSCTRGPDPLTKEMEMRIAGYVEVTLSADLGHLSAKEREIIRILIRAADIMDDIFWTQSYGDREELLGRIENPEARRFVAINYGPWDRMDGNRAFLPGFPEVKPPGANFYPLDMTREEFEAWDEPEKTSLYTLIRRDGEGALVAIPYSQAYERQHQEAARLMRDAAELAEDAGLKNYLLARAQALLDDEYLASDFAWIAMKDAGIDFIVGPIENYEDMLFGHKAAHEAFILVKDREWSARLEKFNAMLPALQAGLPVADQYKSEVPGTDADINVYYAVYYSGDCNAGAKTIAINLPNDPRVHLEVGSRKLMLKNAMRAKFDAILLPIARVVIAEEQQKHITFDAFFENTTFHEVAHGMGIKQTIDGRRSAREALQEYYAPLEEAKADIMGLYLVTRLYELGELSSGEVMDNYVTFFAGIFRSSRFGASSAHGKANMLCMKYFADQGAFTRQADGTYRVDFEKMKQAVTALLARLLVVQGDGGLDPARQWVEADGVMTDALKKSLEAVNAAGIPVDVVFVQGREVLGL